jgi:hypothetical protein
LARVAAIIFSFTPPIGIGKTIQGNFSSHSRVTDHFPEHAAAYPRWAEPTKAQIQNPGLFLRFENELLNLWIIDGYRAHHFWKHRPIIDRKNQNRIQEEIPDRN